MTDDEPDILGEAAKNDHHPLLSDKEVADAVAEARARVRKEAVAAAKKKVIDDEVLRLKREDGKHTGDGVRDEMVPIYIDLAEHSSHLSVNGEPFWHGFTYTVPRHVANSLREQMARGWNHQDDIDGKSITQRLGRRRVADPATYAKGPTGDARFTFSAGQAA